MVTRLQAAMPFGTLDLVALAMLRSTSDARRAMDAA